MGSIRSCPKCGADGQVVDSRITTNGWIRRRRECPFCGSRWDTYEITAKELKNAQRKR